MRWMLSLTAISGKPTKIILATPPEASTSTSTGTASIPTSANVLSLASMITVVASGQWSVASDQGSFGQWSMLTQQEALLKRLDGKDKKRKLPKSWRLQ